MKLKKRTAAALALGTALTLLLGTSAFGANPAEATSHLSVDTGDNFVEELAGSESTVSLYLVANMTDRWEFETLEQYAAYSDVLNDHEAATEQWEAAATEIAALITENGENASYQFALADGAGACEEDITAGVYLMTVEDIHYNGWAYTFAPVLVTLPTTEDGTIPGDMVTDVHATLKPEAEQELASFEIVKTLDNYQANLGEVTTVFRVVATDDEGNVVYDNVFSIMFSASGTKSIVIDELPVGATVTVTEVYTGSSYKLVSDATQTGVVAVDVVNSVSFEDDYDDRLIEGHGVENSFHYDDDSEHWSEPEQTYSSDAN